MQLTYAVRSSYANSWNSMKVNPARTETLTALARKFEANKPRYEAVSIATGVPWYFIAIVHERESDCNFSTYLGNGDPLNHPTIHVPAGRGPFDSWETGAIDALIYQGLDKWIDWSIEGTLYQFEAYNGWGYLGKTNSPYVWSYTDRYSKGKYVADGKYNPTVVDQQPGCAAMLRQMIDAGIIAAPAQTPPPAPSDDIKWVQSSLNKLGFHLAVDGYAGVQTTAAIRQFQDDNDLDPDGIVGPATHSKIQEELSSLTQENDPMGSWITNIALSMLGSAQIQALLRKALTVVGTALLVKLGLDPASAGGLLSQIITALGGAVALGSSAFLSAQWASPNITNPTLIKPSNPTA